MSKEKKNMDMTVNLTPAFHQSNFVCGTTSRRHQFESSYFKHLAAAVGKHLSLSLKNVDYLFIKKFRGPPQNE